MEDEIKEVSEGIAAEIDTLLTNQVAHDRKPKKKKMKPLNKNDLKRLAFIKK